MNNNSNYNRLITYLKPKNVRNEKLSKNLIISIAVKIGGVFINFFTIPLTLKFINTNDYGIWLTISSLYTFMSMFDIGLGNGLRVKLGEALSNNNNHQVKLYISTSYISLFVILTPITFILYSISGYVDWGRLFNSPLTNNEDIIKLIKTLIIAFSVRIFLNLISSILTSFQKTGVNSILDFIANLIISFMVIFLGEKGIINLINLGLIYSITPSFILFLYTFYYFIFINKKVTPNIYYFKKLYFMEIIGIGSKFFILQICSIAILSSGNFIIATLISPVEVTNYTIVQKYFSIIASLYGFIVIPLVPAYNEAYYKKDFKWIKEKISLMRKIWYINFIIVFCLILFSNWVFKIWLGNNIQIPFMLTFSIGIYWIVVGWSTIYTPFINGIGKVNIQLIQAIFSVIITIFLSIFLISNLNFGAIGYVWCSILSVVISSIFLNIQYNKIISQNATGIWNK